MSRNDLLYVKNINLDSDDSESDGDVWDDTKLNEAYDKALRIANAEVAKRIAMSTNTTQENKGVENKETKNKKKSSKPKKGTSWKAGMMCRAIYEEDGIEYEAVISRIINDRECVVKFLGYNNSEIVPLNTLKASFGKHEQEVQIKQACIDQCNESVRSESHHGDKMEYGSDRLPTPECTGSEKSGIPNPAVYGEPSQTKKKKSHKKKSKNTILNNSFELPDLPFSMTDFMRNGVELPVVPPPMLASGHVQGEEQAVSSMLLSWYMSGYYTGLYQGIKRAKNNRRHD